jgi:hypothetical protein
VKNPILFTAFSKRKPVAFIEELVEDIRATTPQPSKRFFEL